MADSNPKDINTVNNINNIDANDYLFVSDQGSALRKVNSNAVSKYAVETYNGTSLGGSNKTVQAAINDLNSNVKFNQYKTTSFAELETIISSGSTAKTFIADVADSSSDRPNLGSNHFSIVGWINASNLYGYEYAFSFDDGGIYKRVRTNSNTWSEWEKQPTRAEVNAVSGESFSIAGNGTVNLTIANNTRAVLYVLTNANDGMNIILVSCSSTGVVYKFPIGTSDQLTITSSANSLSITRTTAGGGNIFARVYAGSVTLAS